MREVAKGVGVSLGGATLAAVLAWATFVAWFSYFTLDVGPWDDVAGTWFLLALVTVLLLHLLWIATWSVWTAAGPARFLAVVLLLPATLWSAYACVHRGWQLSTGAGAGSKWEGWPSVSELLATPSGPLVERYFLDIVVPAAVVAIAVLGMVWVRRRPGGGSVRIVASGVGLIGSLALARMVVLLADSLLFRA